MKVEISKDEAFVQEMRAALKANDGYCPCLVTKTPETKCMCLEFRSAPVGTTCHCGLYTKTEA